MKLTIYALLFFAFSVLFYIHSPYFLQQLCEINTCPICYGTDLCKEFEENKIILQYNSVKDYIFNIFSVKNVFFAIFEGKGVVLKKLAHNSELKTLDELTVNNSYEGLRDALVSDSDIKRFKICDIESAELFLQKLNYKEIQNIQTILHVNVEPILLQIFDAGAGWYVPKLYGFCGRIVVIENTGSPLSYVENFNWLDRAYLAFQILQAAYNFTERHSDFRMYLTDISPDNIAVDQKLKITFIDLEDAIIKKKAIHGTVHHTEHFDEDSYNYSVRDICGSSISDHNIYAVCRLLLSRTALWPMMKNGLLHTPPKEILESYYNLFTNIELCVHPDNNTNRFKLSKNILADLETLLFKFTDYIN